MMALPEGITYSALGLITLGIVGWALWGMVQRSAKRSAAEGGLDQRLPLIIDAAIKPFQTVIERQDSIITEERTEKRRAQDERDKITQRWMDQFTAASTAHDLAMAKLREEAHAAHQRLHGRLDECDQERRTQMQQVAALREQLSNSNRRIEALEDRERKNLRDAPPHGQPERQTIIPIMMPSQP